MYPHDNGIVRAINSTYTINERVVGDPKHTIFIGRLHMKTDEVFYKSVLIPGQLPRHKKQ